jgi:hypothetical protein
MRNSNDDAFLAILGVVVLVALAVGLVISIFFLLTLSRCLTRIQPRNRDMEPGLVWLNLIPCVGTVMIFLTVNWLASSLRKEYESRGWRAGGESFGQGIGMGYAICAIASAIPYIGSLIGIAALICFIMYWVQIANYSRALEERPYGRDRGLDDDDYYDRPYSRRYRDADDRDRGRDDETRGYDDKGIQR